MTAEPPQPAMTDIDALERFVIENDELLALESRIGRFNIFDALDIARTEIRHSNFLAFLLDPAESHGQGQLFLKAILMDLLKNTPSEMRPISPIDLDGTDLRGVEVKREWNHLDIFIRCQEPPFIVVIENKVDAKEGSNQLARYKETVKKHYPTGKTLHVYLTVEGDEASDDDWISYRHAYVHRVLKRVRDTYRNSIGDDVRVFLDLNLIGTRFMKDDELDSLCQQIYKKHRQALNLIWDRGRPMSSAMIEAKTVLEVDSHWKIMPSPSQSLIFAPKQWLDWLPPIGKDTLRSWLYVRLFFERDKKSEKTKLGYAVEMTPLTDGATWEEIFKKLVSKSADFGFKPPKPRNGYNVRSRISSFIHILPGWKDDAEPDAEAVCVAVKKMLETLHPKLDKLEMTLQEICQRLPTSK